VSLREIDELLTQQRWLPLAVRVDGQLQRATLGTLAY
jgi:hypothetical protein